MKIRYSESKKVKPELIDELRASIGWKRKRGMLWKKILKKSDYFITAWHGKELIGAGRIVDDGAMCMIYDLTVRKEFQGKGIGKEIMKRLLKKVKNKKQHSVIGLFTDKGKENCKAVKFYEKLGFEQKFIGFKLRV